HQGQEHGNLATHGVAQQVKAVEAMGIRKSEYVSGHCGVVEDVRMRRGPVIAQVEHVGRVQLAKALAAQRMPVTTGAEETVEDQKRRSFTVGTMKQFHESINNNVAGR